MTGQCTFKGIVQSEKRGVKIGGNNQIVLNLHTIVNVFFVIVLKAFAIETAKNMIQHLGTKRGRLF